MFASMLPLFRALAACRWPLHRLPRGQAATEPWDFSALTFRSRAGLVRWSATLCGIMASSLAAAQDVLPSLQLRTVTPSPAQGATFFLEPPTTPGPWNITTGLWLSAAYRPLTLRDAAGVVLARPLTLQTTLDPTFFLGLGTRGAVGFVVPFTPWQQAPDSTVTRAALGGGRLASSALGDATLVGKVVVIPSGELGGIGLAAVARVTLPTGARTSGLGEGALTSEVRLVGEVRLLAIALQGAAGFKLRTEERSFAGQRWGNEVPWGVGLSVRPQVFGLDHEGHWTWGLETHGSLPAGPAAPFSNAALAPTFLGATTRYQWGDVELLAGIEASLSQAIGAPPWRGVMNVSWSPRSHDKDHDGIPDDLDECAGLPEDLDGFQDSDGCPELDNDDDGILDADDKCPNDKEDEDGFQDNDGCPEPGPVAEKG